MAVIGFVTYEDFCNEIRDAGITTVRLQDYYRRNINGSIGLPEVRSYIELAAVNGDVYICRFSLGGGWDVDSERAQREREQENVERALSILRHDLERRGLTVRPGLIAGAEDSHVSTTCELWRWEHEQGLPLLVPGVDDGN